LGYLFYLTERLLSRMTSGRCSLLGLWFYSQPVNSVALVPGTGDASVVIREVEAGEFPEEAFGRPTGAVPDRFRDGSVCIGAIRGSELVGFMWLHFGPLRERLVRCIFEPLPHDRVAWDYDFYIAPRYRLGRTFARLWDGANRYLRERGVDRTGSWVAFTNRGSARAHERLGARKVGWAVVLSLWRVQCTLASVSPYFHLALGANGISHLRVRVD